MQRSLPTLACSLLLGLHSCAEENSTPDGVPLNGQNRPLPVVVTTVEDAAGYDQVSTYTGAVKSRQTSDLGFQVGGQVTALHFDVGQTFAAGEVLASLDQRRLLANRADVAAQIARARAVLAEMEKGPRQEAIDAARFEAVRFEKEERLAILQLDRSKNLLRDAAASQADVDIAETRLDTVRAQLAGAKSRLAELLAGTRQEQLDAQAALVKSLTAKDEQIGIEIADSELKAPFAGTVAARYFDAGAVVTIGRPVFRLVETDHLEAWIGVPTAMVPKIEEGTTLTIAGQPLEVTDHRVLPELDPTTRTATVVFPLPAKATPRVGELARLELRYRVATPGFLLPLGALTESTRGMWSCYVLDAAPAGSPSGTFVARRAAVEVLHVTVDTALVRGTLQAGDRILEAGTQRVVPGQLVSPK